jgi:two-component system OmpR family sensor kinase
LTLRARLVLAVVALVALAQGAFFAVTYREYRSSEYQQLDSQLREAAPVVDQTLDAEQGGQAGPPLNLRSMSDHGPGYGQAPSSGSPAPAQPRPDLVLPPGTFGEWRGANGRLAGGPVQLEADAAQPDLPAVLAAAPPSGRFFGVPAAHGSTHFEVFEVPDRQYQVVVAIPTTEVDSALTRLTLIEGLGSAGLLAVVSAGAWLVLRRGLRPLERMASTASRIWAGDLAQRVAPSGDGTEVGQLGLALNTMLADIEAAFAERDATEARLRQFLADASHELRTPLTSIQGFAELFRLHGDDARVELPTILRRIEEESARMRVLVEDLLLLARLDQHRPALAAPVDLAVLAADACTDAVAADPGRPVALDAAGPLMVAGDDAHLRQAIGNLLSNALRHTPAASPLEVSCARVGEEAVVSVRDHGPGLDAETLARAFDRFWQGDRARVGTGAGLGLSIVAAIAAEHGGRAEAANAPGGGACFSLILPAVASPPEKSPAGDPEADPPEPAPPPAPRMRPQSAPSASR